jgi:hypothetical protein
LPISDIAGIFAGDVVSAEIVSVEIAIQIAAAQSVSRGEKAGMGNSGVKSVIITAQY